MYELVKNGRGTYQKYMPTILLCPIYDMELLKGGQAIKEAALEMGIELIWPEKGGNGLFSSKERAVVATGWHYRYHELNVMIDGSDPENLEIDNSYIDFKQYFAVPMTYLYRNMAKREFRLTDEFAEQVTLKYGAFLSRVATNEPEQSDRNQLKCV